ncbi:hypothetical protein CC85DRAFT_80937 [Cutaneotrichosporon oleaginosum]|uniref:Uncharacterized protein n=1 Tax=Cutaneotrichosporon oleaginosum TaxID=879819 RepID=A0A0J0XNI4_9TREE|nr:uncharacterized protein CC85DRAFT_80937 [Cutaneotrichosporon oleaginosum]KLT42638.1 hypothetical protein CC85DRAFT_80937 [Cutaneotrichosporon oleaginosum]TXT05245.1 hypothetical protein COLE_06565 [Cutaneotrichosporon oleaginosum]
MRGRFMALRWPMVALLALPALLASHAWGELDWSTPGTSPPKQAAAKRMILTPRPLKRRPPQAPRPLTSGSSEAGQYWPPPSCPECPSCPSAISHPPISHHGRVQTRARCRLQNRHGAKTKDCEILSRAPRVGRG